MTETKDVALIASGGRTGTTFLGEFLSDMVPDAFSIHEPDVWPGFGTEALRRIRVFGFRHMVVDRLRGRSGLRNLSVRRLAGELSHEEAAAEIRRQRSSYYRRLPQPLVVESNYQSFGVVSAWPAAFPEARVAALVRHPATWVASYLDYGTRRGPRDRVQRWGQRRLDPAMIGDDEFAARWSDMSRLERLCWDWRTVNGALLRQAEDDARVRLFRYEDLFLGAGREETFRELLEFLTDFGDRTYGYALDARTLDRRVNVRPDRTEGTVADPVSRDGALREICGDLVEELGYGER